MQDYLYVLYGSLRSVGACSIGDARIMLDADYCVCWAVVILLLLVVKLEIRVEKQFLIECRRGLVDPDFYDLGMIHPSASYG